MMCRHQLKERDIRWYNIKMFKKTISFFNKLDDKIRSRLSDRPILYAVISAIGIVLLWRGIWMIADDIGLSGWASVIVGAVPLLITGVFVSAFIGNRVLLAGLRDQKKMSLQEKKCMELDLQHEHEAIDNISESLEDIKEDIDEMKQKLNK